MDSSSIICQYSIQSNKNSFVVSRKKFWPLSGKWVEHWSTIIALSEGEARAPRALSECCNPEFRDGPLGSKFFSGCGELHTII